MAILRVGVVLCGHVALSERGEVTSNFAFSQGVVFHVHIVLSLVDGVHTRVVCAALDVVQGDLGVDDRLVGGGPLVPAHTVA